MRPILPHSGDHGDTARAALERENAELREQLAQMKEEISGVTNQEVTIKALKDKLRKYESRYSTQCVRLLAYSQ
jgi:uncharacterized protein involved in exopolysaccharide biosynthesis